MATPPTPAQMDRFGLAPRPTGSEPEGNFCFNGFKANAEYWKAETHAEEAVAQATLSKLTETADTLKKTEEAAKAAAEKHADESKKAAELQAETAKSLSTTKETLAATEKDLSETRTHLSDTMEQLAACKDELAKTLSELEEASAELTELHAEYETTKEQLGRREKALAHERFNFATKQQALSAFNERLRVQGELRRQIIFKTVKERTELIAEVEAERQAQLFAANERLSELTSLKSDIVDEFRELMALFIAKSESIVLHAEEDLRDAEADAKLAGSVKTGGVHPRVERMRERQAVQAAEQSIKRTRIAAEQLNEAASKVAHIEADQVTAQAVQVAHGEAAGTASAPMRSPRAGPETALVAAPAAAAMAPMPTGPAAEFAHEAFSRIDKNGDGGISRIELIKAVKVDADVRALLGLPNKISQEDGSRDAFEAVFQAMDSDESKTVSRAEFLRVFGGDGGKPPKKSASAQKALQRAREAKLITMASASAAAPEEPALAAADGADPTAEDNAAQQMVAFALRMGQLKDATPPAVKARDSLEDIEMTSASGRGSVVTGAEIMPIVPDGE